MKGTGYVPLSTEAYALGLERVSARRTGSLLPGEHSVLNLSIEELMRKEALER